VTEGTQLHGQIITSNGNTTHWTDCKLETQLGRQIITKSEMQLVEQIITECKTKDYNLGMQQCGQIIAKSENKRWADFNTIWGKTW